MWVWKALFMNAGVVGMWSGLMRAGSFPVRRFQMSDNRVGPTGAGKFLSGSDVDASFIGRPHAGA